MAWRCSGRTNAELVENLWKNELITDSRVRDAMLRVDRAHFSPIAPYEDSPQTIGHRATISAPHMHAAAAESLLPFIGPGKRVLDIGSGSGYLTAVLTELVFPPAQNDSQFSPHSQCERRGRVVGLEHISELRALGRGNIGKSDRGRKLMGDGEVEFVLGDGRKGWLDAGADGKETGWDAIHVGAAAAELHQELVDQLRSPGRIFIPVEDPHDGNQYIWVVDKDAQGKVTKKRTMGVRYVPLTDAPSSSHT